MGILIKEDVIDFRVVVGHTQGQFTRIEHIRQETGLILHTQQVVQFGLHRLLPPRHIRQGALLQMLIALASIVEIRNGIEELLRVKIRKHHLEIPKGLPRIPQNLQVIAGIESHRRHKIENAPQIPPIQEVRLPLSRHIRMMKMQIDAVGTLFSDELRHLVDILHQLDRVLEGL